MTSLGGSQQNPNSEKLYRRNNLVSSTNKWKGENTEKAGSQYYESSLDL